MENNKFAYFGDSGFSGYKPAVVASTLRSVMYKGTDVDLVVELTDEVDNEKTD